MVAGTAPANLAIEMARGRWLAILDDDDEFTPNHIELLLSACLTRRLEFAYGIVDMELPSGVWQPVGAYPPEYGSICNMSVMFGAHIRFFRYDINAWRLDLPGDWHLWNRMRRVGVRMGFVPTIIGRHYRETDDV